MNHDIKHFCKSISSLSGIEDFCSGALFVFATAICLTFIAPANAQQNSEKLIGISVPLSGNSAALGRQFVAGLRLAQSALPDAKNIKLLVSDDGCNQALGELVAQDFGDAGVKMAAGFLCNEPAYAAAKLLAPANIPLLISGARSIRILKDRKRYSWNVWQMAHSDHESADAAFEYLFKRWQSKPYAIVDDGTVYGRTLADEFRARMEEAGSPPQFVDNFRPAQSTQVGLIRRLVRADVEAVYLAASADDVALIGRNMLEFGPGMEIATGDAVAVLPFIEDNKGIPVGLLAVMQPTPEDLPATDELRQLLIQNELEPEPYLFLGYATMQLITAHLSGSTADELNKLAGKKFDTILGTIEFDEMGKNISKNHFLFRWNGKNFNRL